MKSLNVEFARTTRRALVSVLAATALACSVGISPALAAPQAADSTRLTVAQAPKPDHVKLTKGDNERIAWGKRVALHQNMTTLVDHRTIQYATLDKWDQGHTTWRRQFAAGFLMSGGRLTKISAAERKRVNKYVKKVKWSPPLPVVAGRLSTMEPKKCYGQSGTYTGYEHVKGGGVVVATTTGLNSCQVDILQAAADQVATALGASLGAYAINAKTISKKYPKFPKAAKVNMWGIVVGLVVQSGKIYLGYCQNKSDIGAIWLVANGKLWLSCRGQ